MKVKKRQAYAIAGLLILISGIFVVYAVVTATGGEHLPHEIIVDIGGCKVTLENAINYNWLHEFVAPNPCLSESQYPPAYHLASEIIIEINSVQVTLQEAITQGYFTGTDVISSLDSPPRGHYATEIELISYDNLQVALSSIRRLPCVENAGATCPTGHVNCINLGTIQCYGDCSGSYKASGTSCGTNLECDGAGNCDPVCVANQGATCTNNDCISGQTIQCDGSCAGGSNAVRGTACGQDWLACDGYGVCEGYASKGWSSCPSGFTESGRERTCNMNELLYAGRYEEFAKAGIYTITTLSGVWTSYAAQDPLCGYYACPAGQTNIFGCKVDRVWTGTNWRIKPIPCTPSCTITYPCGTPYSYADGCGGTCSGTGTGCGYGETCYQGSCCTLDCPSASSVPCETWDRSSDGCGGTCNVYGGSCECIPACPSGGNGCDGDGFRKYWGYTCTDGTCVYWEDWAIDSSCDY